MSSNGYSGLVTRVLSEITEVPVDEIGPDTRLREELDVDSLATIELATVLSEETEHDFTEEDFAGATRVADIVSVVAQRNS